MVRPNSHHLHACLNTFNLFQCNMTWLNDNFFSLHKDVVWAYLYKGESFLQTQWQKVSIMGEQNTQTWQNTWLFYELLHLCFLWRAVSAVWRTMEQFPVSPVHAAAVPLKTSLSDFFSGTEKNTNDFLEFKCMQCKSTNNNDFIWELSYKNGMYRLLSDPSCWYTVLCETSLF